jgi:hypothetical protein
VFSAKGAVSPLAGDNAPGIRLRQKQGLKARFNSRYPLSEPAPKVKRAFSADGLIFVQAWGVALGFSIDVAPLALCLPPQILFLRSCFPDSR